MSRKRAHSKKNNNILYLEQALLNNVAAIQEGPTKKKWSLHDLKQIKPITNSQKLMMESYFQGNHVVASGSAGTGKSYIAVWLALNTILDPRSPQDKIIIIRSPTTCKNQGFLPGTLEEKETIFTAPFLDIFEDLLGKSKSYENMVTAGLVEFHTTSYLRGRDLKNSVIILDECQSATFHELNTVISRLGVDSRILILGDISQNDLIDKRYEESGMLDMLKIINKISSFDVINFTRDDIVRSDFVREWIIAKEDLGL